MIKLRLRSRAHFSSLNNCLILRPELVIQVLKVIIEIISNVLTPAALAVLSQRM